MKSIVYVVLVEDRHIDTEVHLFSKSEKAIAFAQKVFDDNIGDRKIDPDDQGLNDAMREEGWLFYAIYSYEGDCVRVMPCDVDAYEDEIPSATELEP